MGGSGEFLVGERCCRCSSTERTSLRTYMAAFTPDFFTTQLLKLQKMPFSLGTILLARLCTVVHSQLCTSLSIFWSFTAAVGFLFPLPHAPREDIPTTSSCSSLFSTKDCSVISRGEAIFLFRPVTSAVTAGFINEGNRIDSSEQIPATPRLCCVGSG